MSHDSSSLLTPKRHSHYLIAASFPFERRLLPVTLQPAKLKGSQAEVEDERIERRTEVRVSYQGKQDRLWIGRREACCLIKFLIC